MAFDIAKALGDIGHRPDDTEAEGRRELRYIPLRMIDRNPRNFYSTDGIDELAENIRLFGLMEPLIVRQQPSGRYTLVSGHRRRLALRKLAEEKNSTDAMSEPVACLVEPDDVPLPGIEPGGANEIIARHLAEELKLIYANADTRVMSSADTAQQVKRTRELFTELQKLGYKFSGKMRDHVAAAAKVSATRVARLDVIDKNLKEPALRQAWKDGTLGETSAYEIARRSPEAQHAAAAFTGPDALQKMTTEQIGVAMDHYEQRAEEDRKAREEWNRSVGTMAEAAGNDKCDFSPDAYLEKMHEEDDILRGICRNNLPSIMRSLMSFKEEYDFSKNFRLPNIDRIRKHDPHSSYSCGWSGNNGTWIDWDSKGIRVVIQGQEFRKTWADFYDALTGAALQAAWKTKEQEVSAADTEDGDLDPDAENDLQVSSPVWFKDEPDHDGRYFCRVLIGKAGKPHEQRMEWKDGGWHVFGDPADKYDMTVQSWWPLPPEV